jgi:hypothetical protein
VAPGPFAGRTSVSHRLWREAAAFASRGRGGAPASHRAGGHLARKRVDRRQFLLSLSRASPRRGLYRRRGGARQRRALIPHALISSAKTKPIPDPSRAARIAARLFAIGTRRAPSKSFTVESAVPARVANVRDDLCQPQDADLSRSL